MIFAAVLIAINLCSSPVAAQFEDAYPEAEAAWFSGEYDECIKLTGVQLNGGDSGERWYLLTLQCEMAIGEYSEALVTVQRGIAANPNSIRLRLAGYDVLKHNNDIKRGQVLLVEMADLIQFRRYRFRSAADQVAQARLMMLKRADAKEVLDRFLTPASQREPDLAEVHLAIGELGLEKHDYQLAADHFQIATELQPGNPAGFLGLAEAWRSGDREKSSEAIGTTMDLNPKYVPGLLYLVDDRINSERYDEGIDFANQIFEINPNEPQALSYRAVIAHMQNDPDMESECRKKAFAVWEQNPQIDHLIGKKLSQRYRFAEGAKLQRRALTYAADYLPAKVQLASDLLRLGNEDGWKLADEVFREDSYNVVAYNLVTLGRKLEGYRVLQRDGFVVRMEPAEADAYGELVLELLVNAKKELCEKYDVEVEEPIFVEIFPKQEDFAIRTFGLPGGSGYLGVCFGRVITMNSPVTQIRTGSNWQAVLWHEFCHVVTLQKTKNKMPRWLSEGISVYEELQKNKSWGQVMTPAYREMTLSEKLTPVSELSSAFLKASSGQDLQFAYFESSMVVEYLVEQYGIDILKKILDDLSIGMPINEVLSRYAGDVKLLDKEFAEFARKKATDLGVNASWEKPELSDDAAIAEWVEFYKKSPDNFLAAKRLATELVAAKQMDQAELVIKKMIELYPDYRGADNGYSLAAKVAREQGNVEREIEMLKQSAQLQPAAMDVYQRLSELSVERQDWADVQLQARRMLAVNPLVPTPHQLLADAAEREGDYQQAAASLQAISNMEPVDPAGIFFRHAVALNKIGKPELARRQLLKCLEEAPRFQEAHSLLLQLVEAADVDAADEDASDKPGEAGKVEANAKAKSSEADAKSGIGTTATTKGN